MSPRARQRQSRARIAAYLAYIDQYGEIHCARHSDGLQGFVDKRKYRHAIITANSLEAAQEFAATAIELENPQPEPPSTITADDLEAARAAHWRRWEMLEAADEYERSTWRLQGYHYGSSTERVGR